MIKRLTLIFIVFLLPFFLSCNLDKTKLLLKKNNDRTSVLYLELNNEKIDSLYFNDWYGNAVVKKFDSNKWICSFNEGGGSGVVFKSFFLFSIKNKKMRQNLHINSYYREGVLGDTTFKKNFIRTTDIIKNNKQIYLRRTCYKNDMEFYYKYEKLSYDQDKQIYFNKKFTYFGVEYNGVKIDSSEYIFYKNKWYDFNSKEKKIFAR